MCRTLITNISINLGRTVCNSVTVLHELKSDVGGEPEIWGPQWVQGQGPAQQAKHSRRSVGHSGSRGRAQHSKQSTAGDLGATVGPGAGPSTASKAQPEICGPQWVQGQGPAQQAKHSKQSTAGDLGATVGPGAGPSTASKAQHGRLVTIYTGGQLGCSAGRSVITVSEMLGKKCIVIFTT